MAWVQQLVIIGSIFHLVVSDGYQKERPEKEFTSGNMAGSHDNTIPGSSGGAAGTGYSTYYGTPVSTDYVSRYYGPIAVPVVLPDGTIADTPEVSAARAAHLAALEKAKALWYGKSGYAVHSSGHQQSGAVAGPWNVNTPYHGPLAMVTVLPSGYLADTQAIAAARAAHLNALLKAQADAAAWKAKEWKAKEWKAWQ